MKLTEVARVSFLLVAAIAVIAGLGLVTAPHVGWASPFQLPDRFGYHGRQYFTPRCMKGSYKGEFPLHHVGSMFGWLTSSKPIFTDHVERNSSEPADLFVRADCLHIYEIGGGP